MFKAIERYRTKYIDPLLDKVPGKQRFGKYRFLPLFFIFGATVELLMIKWTVGETNFYTVLKKKKAIEYLDNKEAFEEYLLNSSDKNDNTKI